MGPDGVQTPARGAQGPQSVTCCSNCPCRLSLLLPSENRKAAHSPTWPASTKPDPPRMPAPEASLP